MSYHWVSAEFCVSWRMQATALLVGWLMDNVRCCVYTVDVWTPFVFGMVTVMVNFNGFNCNFITQNFGRLFLWLFITAMFANLGYAGGIGIIFGSYTLVVTLLALIANFICDGPACLEFAMPNSLEKIAHTISPNENNKTAGEV
eukprot:GHVQ01015974.1.p1 GENE.GHVQ01015974.1~~GHVQ01015974.1.p1  ORF type:complete len:144 (+),score=9.76 GHVQ01015974.1:468-899(+)